MSATAQITKDSLMNKMLNESCTELNKNKDTKFTAENYETQLMMLLLPVFTKNLSLIQKVYGVSMSDSKGMKKIGEELGMKLVIECPTFMKLVLQVVKEQKENGTEEVEAFITNDSSISKAGETTLEEAVAVPTPTTEDTKKVELIKYTPPKFTNETITGTLVSISSTDFSALNIKDKNGKTEKIYWMQYFEDADYFQKNQSKFIGKKVVCTFWEKDVYNAAIKDYKTIKVLNSIVLE
jgi:hypothetical protein